MDTPVVVVNILFESLCLGDLLVKYNMEIIYDLHSILSLPYS